MAAIPPSRCRYAVRAVLRVRVNKRVGVGVGCAGSHSLPLGMTVHIGEHLPAGMDKPGFDQAKPAAGSAIARHTTLRGAGLIGTGLRAGTAQEGVGRLEAA